VRVAETAELSALELVATEAKEPLHRWASASIEGDVSEVVSARYPLGSDATSRADLRFRWRSEGRDVSPQMEILLQVVVDVVAASLIRVKSHLMSPSDPVPESALKRLSSRQASLQRTGP
jgi:hypothetical protein